VPFLARSKIRRLGRQMGGQNDFILSKWGPSKNPIVRFSAKNRPAFQVGGFCTLGSFPLEIQDLRLDPRTRIAFGQNGFWK